MGRFMVASISYRLVVLVLLLVSSGASAGAQAWLVEPDGWGNRYPQPEFRYQDITMVADCYSQFVGAPRIDYAAPLRFDSYTFRHTFPSTTLDAIEAFLGNVGLVLDYGYPAFILRDRNSDEPFLAVRAKRQLLILNPELADVISKGSFSSSGTLTVDGVISVLQGFSGSRLFVRPDASAYARVGYSDQLLGARLCYFPDSGAAAVRRRVESHFQRWGLAMHEHDGTITISLIDANRLMDGYLKWF